MQSYPGGRNLKEPAKTLRQSSQEMLVHSLPVNWAQPQGWPAWVRSDVKSGSSRPNWSFAWDGHE